MMTAPSLALVDEGHAPRVRAGFVPLLQDLQCATEHAVADLGIGDWPSPDLDKLVRTVEDLARLLRLDREELREADRDAVEDALESADQGIGLVSLDQRDVGVSDPGALFIDCFERGLLVRVTGDIVALSPPLIVESKQIDQMVATLADALRRLA